MYGVWRPPTPSLQPKGVTSVQMAIKQALDARDQMWEKRVVALEQQVEFLMSMQKSTPGKVKPEATNGSAKSNGTKICFCCGGTVNVHRHRALQILLDDKCRKQVDTFVKGGIITERREMWSKALRHCLPNKTASEMLAHIEGEAAQRETGGSNKRKKTSHTPPSDAPAKAADAHHPEHDNCTICLDEMEVLPTEQIELPCEGRHTFHKECITTWLESNDSCPTCRESVHLEAPDEPGGVPKILPGVSLDQPQAQHSSSSMPSVATKSAEHSSSCAANDARGFKQETNPTGWLDDVLPPSKEASPRHVREDLHQVAHWDAVAKSLAPRAHDSPHDLDLCDFAMLI